jgi:hypothetical protein
VPDYSPEIYRKAAEAMLRRHKLARPYSHLRWQDFAEEATGILDAVAEDLGSAVAEKILAHMEARGPATAGADWTRRYRRSFATAARVAAFAFLTEDDKLRLAAEALAAGQFVASPGPEDTDG